MSDLRASTNLKVYTSTLLARLVQRRPNKGPPMPLDETLVALLSAHNPIPQFSPAIVDRALLTTLGLNEVQADTLLVLWEAGGELPIWGDGSTPDLCHELDMTSSRIRSQLRSLQALGFVTISAKNRAQWIKAIPPRDFGIKISSALLSSANKLLDFFSAKQAELPTSKLESLDFNPIRADIPRKLFNHLASLANDKKTVFGVITASLQSEGLSLHAFHQIRCQSGNKVHFKPDWSEFHATKRKLIEDGESPIIEFHTHPNSTSRPNPKDIEKMKMLRRGYWFIAGNDGGRLWHFYHETAHKNGRIKLHVDPLTLTNAG